MTNKERNALRALQNRFLQTRKSDLERIGWFNPLWGSGSPSANDLARLLFPQYAEAMQHAIAVAEGSAAP